MHHEEETMLGQWAAKRKPRDDVPRLAGWRYLLQEVFEPTEFSPWTVLILGKILLFKIT